HGDPLTVFVSSQFLLEAGFLVVGKVANAPAGLAQHLESGHRILLRLAIPDRHVEDVLEEGKLPVDRGRGDGALSLTSGTFSFRLDASGCAMPVFPLGAGWTKGGHFL